MGSGILASSKCSSFLLGMGHRQGTIAKGENKSPTIAGLLQRAVDNPTQNAAARHSHFVTGTAGPRAGAACLCLQGTSPIAHMYGC